MEIVSRNAYQPADGSQRYDISTPRDSEASGNVSHNASVSSFQSVVSQAFPWWPESLAYHSMTSLPDGRLSIIVDPGAWTNLMGADLARLLVARAIKMGHKPQQLPMETLNVQGVGNGTQQCRYKLECPIAVPHDDDKTHLHRISTPIVEGTGAALPGLLGLRSLETDRAILDTGRRVLIFPGPGDVKFELPPGSITIPLQKAPSGHLVIPIDDYEALIAAKSGGLKEHSLQFPTTESTEPEKAPPSQPPSQLLEENEGTNSQSSSGPAPLKELFQM